MANQGKYRGKVVNNIDPLMEGRIIALVPAISELPLTWATPCVPYAGRGVGFFAVPPIGANVWIEFEGGATCAYSCNFCSHTGGDMLRVECEGASLQVTGEGIRVVRQGEKDSEIVPLDEVPSASDTMLDLFKAYVDDGVEPPSGGPTNLWTVAMVEAGGISSDEGRIVEIGEMMKG